MGGTIISSLDDEAALTTAFATVFELSEVGEYLGIDLKEGLLKKLVLTIIELTTVIPTPVPFNS